MNCLVLGGAGFIGRHLCAALVAAGHQVRAFDLPAAVATPICPSIPGASWVAGDMTRIDRSAALLDGVELIFHLVSTTLPSTSNLNPRRDLDENVAATLHLLDLIIAQPVSPKIIFLSSGGTVYGVPETIPIPEEHPTDPLCAYGIGKLAIEKYLALYRHLHGLDYRILRLANPYGPRQPLGRGQGVIPVFLFNALHRKPLELWGDGSVVRDYLYIDDLCGALLAALNYRGGKRIFNIGSGQGHSLNALIDIICQALEVKIEPVYLPGRACDVPRNILNIQRAKQELGWQAETSLADG
ncbi:MAG: NAD-dependent epimerase/dehydratase family protein, partial [Thermodesulfobacteriota bacterium]|nr:NAD-dependent epimerase/dehydratase family protein [Thermodesulfobacteriota bacterium]